MHSESCIRCPRSCHEQDGASSRITKATLWLQSRTTKAFLLYGFLYAEVSVLCVCTSFPSVFSARFLSRDALWLLLSILHRISKVSALKLSAGVIVVLSTIKIPLPILRLPDSMTPLPISDTSNILHLRMILSCCVRRVNDPHMSIDCRTLSFLVYKRNNGLDVSVSGLAGNVV